MTSHYSIYNPPLSSSFKTFQTNERISATRVIEFQVQAYSRSPFIYLSLRLTGTALELSREGKIKRKKNFAVAAATAVRFYVNSDGRIIF